MQLVSTGSSLQYPISIANAQVTDEQRQQLERNDLLFGADFARIVSVMMRHEPHRSLRLADLETRVMPPLFTGQFALLNVLPDGALLPVPVAVALWATISPDADQRVSSNINDFNLTPTEWRSGDIIWLVDMIGDIQSREALRKELNITVFKDRNVKSRLAVGST